MLAPFALSYFLRHLMNIHDIFDFFFCDADPSPRHDIFQKNDLAFAFRAAPRRPFRKKQCY
jgi:hypothetical protein